MTHLLFFQETYFTFVDVWCFYFLHIFSSSTAHLCTSEAVMHILTCIRILTCEQRWESAHLSASVACAES